MAKIGKFKKVGDELHGSIITLSVQHQDVRLVPTGHAHKTGETTPPSHLVMVGEAEVGAAWSRQSEKGGLYYALKIDDPSFSGAIYPTLTKGDDGGWNLIWSRGGRP